ncbi:MAG: alpha/beta hydrolase, partial [Pseudomonadota bacterium]|nr:alpha/beta hydrolase [Pseudomonadota bacterium]
VDFDETSWRPHVTSVNVPTLVIQNRNDGYLDAEFVTGVYEDLNVEKELLWIDVPKQKSAFQNRLAGYDWLGTHPEPILKWFNKYLAE